jgi:DNA repair exonuclease SbcCD ATPase subunit
VNDLKLSLSIHKDIVQNLLIDAPNAQNKVIESIFNEMLNAKEKYEDVREEKECLEAKILILEQINDEIKFKEKESEMMLQQRIQELNEAIERKEFLFQLKEQKWAAIEQIMVNYAREDVKLQKMLADLRYICDDVSTRRNVKNVLQENDELRRTILSQKKTIDVLSLRLQENLSITPSESLTLSSSKKATSSDSKKLPDLNCFNIKVVDNQITFLKKSETERYEERIRYLEERLDEREREIRDLKSSMYDLNDENAKAIRKIKEFKKKNR